MTVRLPRPCFALPALLLPLLAQADPVPLDAAALRACATRVVELRSGSAQLTLRSSALEARRAQLDARAPALQNAGGAPAEADLDAHLDLQQRRRQHHDEALAFNAEVAQQRQAVDALNGVKQDYARECAGRPYRRRDFTALPASLQAAMRAGLDDVVVPYVDPASR
ncbi:hypothetical protein [Solimonas marina]|uniref:Uncharacterized protein n=1 Tax=Solimonas marina TaxID=2714601 RepID=A0A970B5T9_9GAMM|nr:hypothetical protein [Solimonas marina]NKF22073.1 hypothetical protein [Solimonas marina]